MNFSETNERALQTGPQANPSPTGHPPVSHPLRPNGKKGSELSSRENSKAVSHFILKIHTKFEFHSTGYSHLFCCDNFNIIGLNYLSLSKMISSCGLCTLNIPLLFRVPFREIWLPRWFSGKEFVCQCRRYRRGRFDPWVRKIPWRRKWQTTPVFLPGKPHGQRSLVGYSLWGHKERLSMNACIFQKFSFCKRRAGNSVFTYFISSLFSLRI